MGKDTEATLRRIPRSQWIEWLDDLAISGEVAVVANDRPDRHIGGGRFRSADYDPFEDVLEITLDDERRTLRVLLESPTEILAVGSDTDPDRLAILAADGPLVITRSSSQRQVGRRGVRATGSRLIPL